MAKARVIATPHGGLVADRACGIVKDKASVVVSVSDKAGFIVRPHVGLTVGVGIRTLREGGDSRLLVGRERNAVAGLGH